MKHLFALFVAGVLFSSFTLFSSIDEVISAMKTGNASEIARFFDNTVEINMPQKNNSYSKSQAELVLKDFFNTNPVKAFETIHKGENSGSQYCIGTLVTKNGSFRTTIFMKQKGDKQVLQEITFENK
jgi:antitoxin component YwqK of YwqJK toxin-antitoxin module